MKKFHRFSQNILWNVDMNIQLWRWFHYFMCVIHYVLTQTFSMNNDHTILLLFQSTDSKWQVWQKQTYKK